MSMKMTMAEFVGLEPCPFCGGEAETFNPFPNVEGTWCVLCSECAAATGFEQTEAEAIAAWNTRAELGSEINGDTSDGYHTFNELYHHRAVLFSVIVRDHRELAWKARKHHDGTMYEGMFIVGIETPKGQATYHYDLDPYWEMFDCEEREFAPEWDGHTPDDAIARIAELGSDTKPCYAADENYKRCKYSVNRGWCDDAPFIVWDDTGHLFITMGGLKTWDVTDDVKKWFAELGNGTLTAEQVREAVMSADRWEKPMSNTGLTNTHLIIRDDGWQAIADELNADRHVETCHIVTTWCDSDYLNDVNYRCSECGGLIVVDERNPDDYFEIISHANYCCNCGAKVVDNAD